MELGNLKSWRGSWSKSRWSRTRALAWAGVAISVVLTLVGTAAQDRLTEATLLAIPVGLFLGVLVLPLALAVLIFLAARAQARADRLPDPGERPGEAV